MVLTYITSVSVSLPSFCSFYVIMFQKKLKERRLSAQPRPSLWSFCLVIGFKGWLYVAVGLQRSGVQEALYFRLESLDLLQLWGEDSVGATLMAHFITPRYAS